MDGKRLIEKIRLRNILSFGDKGEEITLEPLNVIIGQNASGKSNLVEIFHLLNSAANNFIAQRIGNNGGINDYLWRGSYKFPLAEIGVYLNLEEVRQDTVLYELNKSCRASFK
jgi:predicted ATPase